VPNAVVTENLTVGSLTIGPGGAGLSTDDVSEGSTNLYHTTARARAAFSGGDGINLSATGVISFDGQGQLDTYNGNKFIATGSYRDANNYAYMDGAGASGSGTPYLRIGIVEGGTYSKKVEFAANLNVSSDLYLFGNLYAYTGTTKTFDYKTSSGILELKTPGGTKKVEINGATGSAIFAGDVTTNGSFSDERLKENIVPLDKGLETIEQIKTYTFNYKNRPQDTHPGVIAQEIEELVPEVVYDIEMEDGTYKAVRYQQLVPLLINAIKDLSEKVNVLENKLNNKE
ncbi:MAG: tail fiber domain-containing protein, partial [Methylophagaceae bacterium]